MFASRAALLGRVWLRAGYRFLKTQTALVDQALSASVRRAGVEAVVAAADAPVVFAEQYPDSSRLLLTVRREELLKSFLPNEIEIELRELDALLISLLTRLAVVIWDRKDTGAIDTITTCLMDLPTAVLLHRDRLGNKTARKHLHAAVRAVLEVGPPP
ncbi:hypothetical protein JK2ML_2497 [Mycobacterium leprae Kyoto-2]|uniref:TetR-family transcriptional regulator n=3 Tax=Mycobacterium leprae TaxID=1769 RepID=Q9CB22_MYCLE|nr:TetR family transcriptional regulator [Mycobacterium leprae 3125609]OAX72041.1 TetR family transcriptional regulator [Mycobacterium leprae 7935681]BBC17777.1 hypothetical protein JK2ML_2497 [Mycobacterium leprae Kyoto-2]CAC32014.1 hypothetical protein [Mycobacterium leprae]CAR72596.1 hypothetical protein MLBr02497 [Mycobacterium leprae Br4923]